MESMKLNVFRDKAGALSDDDRFDSSAKNRNRIHLLRFLLTLVILVLSDQVSSHLFLHQC